LVADPDLSHRGVSGCNLSGVESHRDDNSMVQKIQVTDYKGIPYDVGCSMPPKA
jgi:hypothetical protein